MEKIKLHEDDIEILDNIIRKCIENNIVRTIDLPPPDNDFWSSMKTEKESYYRRFFEIIQGLDLAEAVTNTLDSAYLKPKIPDTERFYNEGGFKKLYEDQQKAIETEKIIQEKERNEAVLLKWHKKTYWWTFGIAMAGFIIATIALILTIVKE